ncbi:Origin recognition complex subunit 6 [Frankliniella fusca]|uniref:Origin recognition complex subunit 6 n=1 Tax=Frankliniella fusca TaxID=407009 RepID=A0AAE1HL23_9NEOP|nr:Origin recognition complex subunit 6 [Frankliniella fusca]
MASFDAKLVNLMASKMGIDSDSVTKRASEYLRRLQLRVTASSGARHINDTGRVVICLDLAAKMVDHPFDKTDLLRLAGLNKAQYANSVNLIENLLELSKPVNVQSLCVQLGVSEVAPTAQKVLNKYAEIQSHGPNGGRLIDTTLPVYHSVSVLIACKYNKVKVDKAKLVEASRVKKVQFDKLVEDFTPVLDSLGTREKKTATKRSHKLIDLVSKMDEDAETDSKTSESTEIDRSSDPDNEDFEVWKKRILSEAGMTS